MAQIICDSIPEIGKSGKYRQGEVLHCTPPIRTRLPNEFLETKFSGSWRFLSAGPRLLSTPREFLFSRLFAARNYPKLMFIIPPRVFVALPGEKWLDINLTARLLGNMLCQIVYIISAFPSLNPDPCDDCDEEKEWGVRPIFSLVCKYILLTSRNPSRIFDFLPYVMDMKNLIKSFALFAHGLDVGRHLMDWIC